MFNHKNLGDLRVYEKQDNDEQVLKARNKIFVTRCRSYIIGDNDI